MAPQTYETHRHNPKMTGIGFMFLMLGVIALALRWFNMGGRETFALGLLGLIGAILTLLIISRAYTTRLQDRIIKLEMQVRCAALPLTADQRGSYSRLSTPQIVALRFAPDDELPALLDRAAREQLTDDQIKRAVTSWRPDLDRT